MERHLNGGYSWQRKTEYKDSEVLPNEGEDVDVLRLLRTGEEYDIELDR